MIVTIGKTWLISATPGALRDYLSRDLLRREIASFPVK
jgi:hypothetical protein